jgi:creatinine amidohydrolase
VRQHTFEVAVLPVGSCEPHGLHLPYATDTYQVTAIAESACAKAWERGAKVVLLPTIPYGVEANLMAYPMTIHVRQDTLNTLIRDIVASLEQHGVRKLVILNGHGGNEFRGGIRDLFGQTQVWIFLVDWWKIARDERRRLFDTPGEHADEVETSLCLAIVPHLVRMEDADDGAIRPFRFAALQEGWVWTTRPWDRVTRNSAYGDPRKATAEKGARYMDIITDRLADFLVALAQSPIDELFPFVARFVEAGR